MITVFLALTILINEVMPAPTNTPEWVELYNPSTTPISIGGWYLDDDTPGGTQIIIPADTVIAPTSLHVVTLNSAILNNTGDAITLYDATGQLVDRIDFGAMKSSESLSRVPDGSTLIIKAPPSPGLFNSAGLSPTPHPPTITPSPTITLDHTVTVPTTTTPPELHLSETPSETLTMTPQQTPSPSQSPIATDAASPTRTPSPTKTPSETRTPSPTKTPSETRTPSPTKTPSESRTPSPTKTPSETRTPSPTEAPLVSLTRTPSFTRTASVTKTTSRTRTPRPSKTPRNTRTPKSTQTPRITTPPRATRTSLQRGSTSDQHLVNTHPTTTPLISITGHADTPQLMVCPPHPSTLHNWVLIAHEHQITLPDSRTCVTVDLPTNPPTYWRLANPHGVVIATIDVFTQYCARDISDCKPSPTVAQVIVHVDTPHPRTPSMVLTHTPQSLDEAVITPLPMPHSPNPTTPSTIPLGMLLMLGGWIALKMLARPTADVLYSEADEDAASSADPLSSESRKV